MSGLPAVATLQAIVAEIFQNEKVKECKEESVVTFSNVKLSRCQEEKLSYPCGFKPLCVYILYQTDRYPCEGCPSSNLQLISLAKKGCDKHIYAFYFNLCGQERFHVKDLRDCRHSVRLCSDVNIEYSQYLEVFNWVGEKVLVLGHQEGCHTFSSLQYSDCEKYYYGELTANGYCDPCAKPACLTGLSKNLRRFLECHEKKEKCKKERSQCEEHSTLSC